MYVVWRLFLFSLFIIGYSCEKRSEIDQTATPIYYLYISHTRLETNDSIYNKIYGIDFDRYSATLLGGDLAKTTFANDTIQNHLDAVFNFKHKATLWSIGNHDRTSNEKFRALTGKNKFHHYQQDDASFITLDSQDSLSSIVGAQKEFLLTTLDTLTTKNVVILCHKLIFMDKHHIMDPLINETSNGRKGDCFYCLNPNNFQAEIYPELLKIKNKGKNIFWIGGDLGYKTSSFEYVDTNGITFLGNGVWHPREENKALLFKNQGNEITYRFTHIDSLLKHESNPKYFFGNK
ncbi:hypothetical protein [Cochleicola gelatinilyticus]|uniref:Calcineurin-like phosphoesterase domain-containing protein n=1 Tax=Cochleicola gelatinilyticus TaxID=1763537 RepID=A0A167IL60_9FLAO|nr:hypothetical protein [Cochleicola gelatinilyticus]OAB79778.1 hypothetical protein ULVI_03265 [Cochleicola gelatinilyticus]